MSNKCVILIDDSDDEIKMEVDNVCYTNGLRKAIRTNNLPLIKQLVENGEQISDDDFMLAIMSGKIRTIKYLVEMGAKYDANDNMAIKVAASNKHFNVVKYLVNIGANVCIDNYRVLRCAINSRKSMKDLSMVLPLFSSIELEHSFHDRTILVGVVNFLLNSNAIDYSHIVEIINGMGLELHTIIGKKIGY